MQATYQKVSVNTYFKVVLKVVVNNNILYIALQFFFEPEREHWVATTYLDGQVQLYDSKFTGRLSTCLTKQICQIYQNAVVDERLLVAVVAVQQQTGATECGVMAIANGYHAVCGDDLSKVSFVPEEMRGHLSTCMENKLLTPFPTEITPGPDKGTRIEKTFKYINIEVSCECKRPDIYQNMIACDNCDRWMHMECAGLSTVPTGQWFCVNCI